MDPHLASLFQANKNHVVFRCIAIATAAFEGFTYVNKAARIWWWWYIYNCNKSSWRYYSSFCLPVAAVSLSSLLFIRSLFLFLPHSFSCTFWLCSSIVFLSVVQLCTVHALCVHSTRQTDFQAKIYKNNEALQLNSVECNMFATFLMNV